MKVATVANLVDAFEDLGFTIDDPKAIDRLVKSYPVFGNKVLSLVVFNFLLRGMLLWVSSFNSNITDQSPPLKDT